MTQPASHRTPVNYEAFIARMSASIERLQSLLRTAFEASLPRETGARACGRAIGVTRTLGWQAWTLAYAPDAGSALARLPGPSGWKLLLAALARSGRPPAEIRSLQAAFDDLRATMASSRSNAALARMMATGGMPAGPTMDSIARARRYARHATETLHGLRCELAVAAVMMGPPDARERCDLATVNVLDGLRRTRPGPAWPIYRWSWTAEANASRRVSEAGRALSGSDLAPLVPDLSTPGIERGEIRRLDAAKRSPIAIADVNPSRRGGIRTTFIEVARRRGVIPKPGHVTSGAMIVTVPARHAIFDLIVHRSVRMLDAPLAAAYSCPDPRTWASEGTASGLPGSSRIPLEREATTVNPTGLPAPRRAECSAAYHEAIRRAAAAMGQEPADFMTVRIELPDPPLHGILALLLRRR